MPAKDFYHDTFVNALKKDSWTIAHDPLTVSVGKTDLLIDLGAERMLAAERGDERIAVEIKSFIKPSLVQDLKEALGQYIFYEGALLESPEKSVELFSLRSGQRLTKLFLTKPLARCCCGMPS